MADSSITKKALAASLKKLMNEKPFAKISVGEICEGCDMNRKSFYYHFCDKYDLVNWIFDTEYLVVAKSTEEKGTWDALDDLCDYFYQNKSFYRKALKIQGQNSFSDHFRDVVTPFFKESLEKTMDKAVTEFHINFFADAFICSIERWILDKGCVSAEEFSKSLKSCVHYMAYRAYEVLQEKNAK